MAVGNIDEDPRLEIVISGVAGGPLYAWHHDGALVKGWPIWDVHAAPVSSLGNLSHEHPGLEVLAGFSRQPILAAYSGNGRMLPAWPMEGKGGIGLPTTLADVDGDGLDEIFTGQADWKLHAYRADGTRLEGWPIRWPPRRDCTGACGDSDLRAVADLDGDGDLEIVTANHIYGHPFKPGPRVYAYHHDGTRVAGFPVFIPHSYHGRVSIGDVDGDGAQEIVFHTIEDTRSYVHIISGSGRIKRTLVKWGWYKSAILANLDGDSIPEIVLQTGGSIDIRRGDGSYFPGWPVVWSNDKFNLFGYPAVVGDVDGDRLPDIVVTNGTSDGRTGEVRVYNRNGVMHPRFPKRLQIGHFGGPAAIADIDLDGRNEIIVSGCFWSGFEGYFDKVWAYDLGGPQHGKIEWGQLLGGPRHQGRYEKSKPAATANIAVRMTASPAQVRIGQNLTYKINIVNRGPDWARNVSVVDTLPSSFDLVSAESSRGSCTVATHLVCDLGPMGSGKTATATIVVKPKQAGEISNTVTAAGFGVDRKDNNMATVVTTVLP